MTDALHFERPPLDEVVCGVQFAGVEWSVIHFGCFIPKYGNDTSALNDARLSCLLCSIRIYN